MEINETIIGFLTGSLATLIIKGLIDYFSKRTEYKRDLLKITYQRKLELAEKATAYYYTYFSKVLEMKKSLEIMIKATKDDAELDIDILNDMIKSNSKIVSALEKKQYEVNAVHLYFNLDNLEYWNEKDLNDLFESASIATYHSNEIIDLTNTLNSLNETNSESDDEEYYSTKIKEKLPIYVDSLQKFINSLEKTKNATYQSIQEIKKQIK